MKVMELNKKQLKNIKEEIPLARYDNEHNCFQYEDGSYMDVYQIHAKDLVNSNVDEIEMDCFQWAKFYKTYGLDTEIVTMMFPCDTGRQQQYWKNKLKKNRNPYFRDMLEVKINELAFREKHATAKEFFLLFFYENADQIANAVNTIDATLGIGRGGLLNAISIKKKKQILRKFGNKNSMIFWNGDDREGGEAPSGELLREIAPAGGIRHHEFYSRTGTGYESCIHVYDLPAALNDYWMKKLCYQENSIAAVSVHNEDQIEVKKNLNKSIEEQGSRKRFAREYKDFYDAEQRESEMKALFDEIDAMGEVMKSIDIRIFTVGKTMAELEEANGRVIKTLESDSYRAAVFLNESREEFCSIYRSSEQQQKCPHQLARLPVKATLLAAGNPYHFSSLEDIYADFLGQTSCGGNVLFDDFFKSDIRVNYSAVIVGNQRFGKSTLLKNRFKSRALRGDFIRTFDITGEFSDLTRALGGRVINMDGTEGIINLLEIFRAGETEENSYARHLSKLRTTYRFLKPDADTEELNAFRELLERLYEGRGLCPGKDGRRITGLPAKQYPVFSDLLRLLETCMEELAGGTYTEVEKSLASRRLLLLDNIKGQLQFLVSTYGYLFDGHTTVDNMMDVKIVTYNLTSVKDLDEEIFDLQIFNVLSICWDNAITNGVIMKEKWESGEITLEDVTHFLLLIDESHRWVNTRKLFALDHLSSNLREGPKYFIGIWLASQSIRDFAPEGSSDKGLNTLKTIFELTQYKFIFHQDANAIPVFDKVFNNALTYAQRTRIPQLQKGETILCISGDQNIEFKVYLSKADEKLFKGGA